MLPPMPRKAFILISKNYLNNLMANIIMANINNIIESLLMPCIYFSHFVRGSLGSLFLRQRYSAT
jgi:hypothetical protein